MCIHVKILFYRMQIILEYFYQNLIKKTFPTGNFKHLGG
ncbi:hypothetical protein GYO_3693 [Bacillus spizizenii TU-B-10]|uniref:Uncharacterized protein n=1 Tax=Bacillus spizizenii (strain DSM 15029 / JCM 12233 / NBRC 101239 / NRRL B-23049 / TU-B-10) TaxID=1052585 RepID=G4P0T9_BACS4|nr:hypothetical protein GYO_3693 [Bacillus spizizenii TU-B-10]SCV38820.1 hypothetical protein BQ1740_0653 [Bacillus subtilis]